jgi:dTDP-4-dehydrorhamnose 3,5-epimerase
MNIQSNSLIKESLSKKFKDKRGYIEITHESDSLIIKNSYSLANVFRGLHIQIPPFPQSKYIWVEEGEIIDLCLNLNCESKHYGEYQFISITSKNGVFQIPPYMAHGFISKKPTRFSYICIGRYSSSHEISIKPSNDIFNELGFKEKVIISNKDKKGMDLNKTLSKFQGIRW